MFYAESRFVGLLIWFILPVGFVGAEEVAVDAVLAGLDHPCGIAVRPGGTADRFELFIADRGSGKVVKWSNRSRDKFSDVVTGFPRADQDSPRCLMFLDSSSLVVGCSSADGKGLVKIFELPEDGGDVSADVASQTRGLTMSGKLSGKGRALCWAFTRSRANEYVPDMLILAIRGVDGRAALYRSRIQAGILAPLQALDVSGVAHRGLPVALATSNSGRIVIASAPGAQDKATQMTYINPIDYATELQYALVKQDVTALAYSPATRSLYALNTNPRAGICRVEDASEPGKPACRTVDIAAISGATALAFAPDGALYVTATGRGVEDGTLQILNGDL